MGKKNNTTGDSASSSTAKRTRKIDASNSKIELETFEDNKLDEAEFHESITRQYTGTSQPGSLLNSEEKPRLKRALKARHVSSNHIGSNIKSLIS
jgi:hypothetical protein